MYTIQGYEKVKSLEEAYELNQKKSSSIIGGGMWLRLGNRAIGKAIDLSDLGLDKIEETEEAFIIGCMTPLRDIECHEGMNRYFYGMMKETFKNIFSFEFWQKFGKALMVVIAVMPAAGLMISIGKSIPMINPNVAALVTTGGILEQIGWGVIGNLHILFALAIGGSWAKERAGGAFAAGLSFILINRITGVFLE